MKERSEGKIWGKSEGKSTEKPEGKETGFGKGTGYESESSGGLIQYGEKNDPCYG